MDGRAVEATVAWMKEEYHLDFVDAITEPGLDAYLGKVDAAQRAWLKRKIEISVVNHGSRTVSVVGHDDCAGNPVSIEEHKGDILRGVRLARELVGEIDPALTVEVFGLWSHATVDPKVWVVERVD